MAPRKKPEVLVSFICSREVDARRGADTWRGPGRRVKVIEREVRADGERFTVWAVVVRPSK